MKTIYKHIFFEEISLPRKTKTFVVRNKAINSLLGTVKWYAPWRQYCFFPTPSDLVFSATCLADIQDFIRELMNWYRRKQ